jgi:hypothetical protein
MSSAKGCEPLRPWTAHCTDEGIGFVEAALSSCALADVNCLVHRLAKFEDKREDAVGGHCTAAEISIGGRGEL